MYKSKLSYANLSYANLSESDLSYANLYYTNLSYANLSYATLSHIDLSYANLTESNVSCAFIQECEGYNNLICDRADFDSAHIYKEDLLTYVNRNGSVNVPQQIGYKINEKAASLEAIDIYPKVESQSLHLRKQRINLNEVILGVIVEYAN